MQTKTMHMHAVCICLWHTNKNQQSDVSTPFSQNWINLSIDRIIRICSGRTHLRIREHDACIWSSYFTISQHRNIDDNDNTNTLPWPLHNSLLAVTKSIHTLRLNGFASTRIGWCFHRASNCTGVPSHVFQLLLTLVISGNWMSFIYFFIHTIIHIERLVASVYLYMWSGAPWSPNLIPASAVLTHNSSILTFHWTWLTWSFYGFCKR